MAAERVLPLSKRRLTILENIGIKEVFRKPELEYEPLDLCLMDFSGSEPAIIKCLQLYGDRVARIFVQGGAADLSLCALTKNVAMMIVCKSSTDYAGLAANAHYMPNIMQLDVMGRLRKEDARLVIEAASHWDVGCLKLFFGDEGGTSFITERAACWPFMKYFNLDNVDADGIKSMFEAAPIHWKTINHWELTHGNICHGRPDISEALARSSRGCPEIQTIELDYQGLSARDVLAIAAGVWGNLQILELSHNPLGDDGVTALAGAAARWAQLATLKLIDVGCEDAGARALVEGVKKWPHMLLLNMWQNHNITFPTIAALEKAIKKYCGPDAVFDKPSGVPL